MDWSSNPLFETAFALGRAHAEANPGRRSLPPLLFLTDPDRTPEPWDQAARLPNGAGVVFRGFGRADAQDMGERLGAVCRARGLTFLVGLDADLAVLLHADGLHLPERALGDAAAVRKEHPQWLLTGATHSRSTLDAAHDAGLDAALLSSVFESQSRSAGLPLGVDMFAEMTRTARLPVYALGGITMFTAQQLKVTGACGLAFIGALSEGVVPPR